MKKPAKQETRARALMVIPTLGKRLDLLRQSLQSVSKQKPYKYDIYVVCPSRSPARKVAREFGATVIDDPGKGISAALNAGFAATQDWHEFGSWMGDDDLLRPGSLATTLKALDKNPKAVLAFGHCDYIDDNGRVIFTSRAGLFAPWIIKWGPNLIPLMGILYRLEPAKNEGGYDESLKYSMDLDMWLKLSRRGKLVNTGKTLGAFRWHPLSTTVANRSASFNEAEMVRRRYLSPSLKPLAPLWSLPIHFATSFAHNRVNKLAKQ